MEYKYIKPINFDGLKATKKQKQLLKDIKVGVADEIIKNPISGFATLLTPEAVAIYDVIMGCEVTLTTGGPDKGCEVLFQEAKEVFLKNWPCAYMILID